MNKIFVPPIKSQGIKTKIVPWILKNIELNDKGLWIEPFMGTGVVGLNVRPKKALFSDINPHVINFYNAIKSRKITPGIARAYLEEEGNKLKTQGEEYYYAIRDRFNKEHNPLDFLFLSRSCFNGMIRFNRKGGFNVPFCRKPKRFSAAYITKIVNQIQYAGQAISTHDWTFVCQDYRLLINGANEMDFIYCDPPYFGRHVDYYNSWDETDESNLYAALRDTKAKFMLSTWYKNPFRENIAINKYWKDFFIQMKDHFYHVGGKEENRNPVVEALITNYFKKSISADKSIKLEPEQMALLEHKKGFDTGSSQKRKKLATKH